MKVKHALITDLDNTLFDWFEFWYQSFSAMFREIQIISGVPEDILYSEIKKVHQKYGTSEYAFLIEELPCLREVFPKEDLLVLFAPAIDLYRRKRRETLKLYSGVHETLDYLKNHGVTVIGYTESMAFYSNYRIRSLNLDGRLDFLFSPADHDIPPGLLRENIRKYPSSRYELCKTTHLHTPSGELKPNPDILLDLCEKTNIEPERSVYIGDNLYKDVRMAQEARIDDVYAAYGKAHTREEYQLLVSVTHWTDDDVRREKELEEHHVSPSYKVERSYSEILQLFDFRSG